MTTTKSNRAQELHDAIQKRHDMQRIGGVWSWEACGVQGKDQCAICGLTNHWGSGGQNTGEFSRWEDFHGNELTLAEAARRECA